MKKFLFLFITLLPAFALAQTKLVPHKIALKDGRSFSLNLPADYEIVPAAEGLKRGRFFARAPDGRIFVTDMYNLTDNERGAVYILDEWDAERGKFGKVIPYMTGLKNPNSVQFYRDANGQDWFYLAETDNFDFTDVAAVDEFADFVFTQNGLDVTLTWGVAGESLVVKNTTEATLTANQSDFLFT